MRIVFHLFAVVVLAVVSGATPAFAWWRYAKWGMSGEQVVSASGGQAVPCRAGVPVCSSALTGAAPALMDEAVNMVGLQGSAAFVFDAKGELIRTVVLFPAVDFAQASAMLQGIHGKPAEDRPGEKVARVWRDEQRGSVITVTASGSGTLVMYRPI
jgi:hypothetical protein